MNNEGQVQQETVIGPFNQEWALHKTVIANQNTRIYDRDDGRATPYGTSSNVNRFRGARHNSIDDGGKTIQSRYDRWSNPNGEKTSVGAILNPKHSFGNQFKTFHEAKDGELREKDNFER